MLLERQVQPVEPVLLDLAVQPVLPAHQDLLVHLDPREVQAVVGQLGPVGPLDQLVRLDGQGCRVPVEFLEQPERREQVDRSVLPGRLDRLETRVRLALQVLQALVVQLDHRVLQVRLAKQEVLGPLDKQE